MQTFIERTEWIPPVNHVEHYRLIKILEAFDWKVDNATRFHNRRKMTPEEQLDTLSPNEAEQLLDFLKRSGETAEPGDYEKIGVLIEIMESFGLEC